MPVINRIADFGEDMKTWRRWMHAHPEFGLECHQTAAYVVERLREFGVDEIHEKIGVSGVVAVINGQGEGPTIGLRADMDALPMQEMTGLDYASQTDGMMHACGHDGHTTMLLGAARYLAETRNFSGRVALIFQPAEENFGGAKYMCDDGLMDRFGIQEVYALHNLPGEELGSFITSPGPLMAAVDTLRVNVTGVGGHGAHPDECRDPIMALVSIAQALQSIVSRNLPPMEQLVISVTQVHGGTVDNVIPETAWLEATIRSFTPEVRDLAERRVREIVAGLAAGFDVSAEVVYDRGYPATVNHAEQTEFALGIARELSGEARVDGKGGVSMGAEDFAYMLEERPGAYLFLGQGEGPYVHHPEYDFNDDVSPYGASFFARLVEKRQPVT
ncbi:putative hydrolase YxeP [Aliiroseovarius sp. xm-m-379]|uniref:M20 aminoacylase family protein n=1 Tax=unclassified Aliiroseovarius TaxID=2623558 RepID=UPI001568D2CF|nr:MULTISPECIES: M20 aminoacylase family protein [unclassified Aliiroseovarius]NRP12116.1 putative hydrolase YxeP [Aliiroseovarius sp. xm-d-517]NRP25344.1 putative hydrolase YxeP [Aliiroseovarius sp. xm-m-379]NRP30928.1 putative hydrolase YxeP [Aliiroseovarius sp. xm-m-314]NRP34143.1 putative hydrolase YxeP [Aliiroseovarius sp. xm-a-104]NRP41390.1 putative hydrolase YxeP [Aliiroseovarius sp. xm-m-339-2]